MKILNKIISEAKYYGATEDDLDGQTEAILNMPAVAESDLDIDDELGMIDDIETRASNLGSVYGDEDVEYGQLDEVPGAEVEEDEDTVYEITTSEPVCPCCGCKLVITDLPSEGEEVVDEEDDEDEIEIVDEEDGDGDEEIEVVEDEDEDGEESEDEDEDDDEIEIVDEDDED